MPRRPAPTPAADAPDPTAASIGTRGEFREDRLTLSEGRRVASTVAEPEKRVCPERDRTPRLPTVHGRREVQRCLVKPPRRLGQRAQAHGHAQHARRSTTAPIRSVTISTRAAPPTRNGRHQQSTHSVSCRPAAGRAPRLVLGEEQVAGLQVTPRAHAASAADGEEWANWSADRRFRGLAAGTPRSRCSAVDAWPLVYEHAGGISKHPRLELRFRPAPDPTRGARRLLEAGRPSDRRGTCTGAASPRE